MLNSSNSQVTNGIDALSMKGSLKWTKPTIKTITFEELKKYMNSNACSDFEACPNLFR